MFKAIKLISCDIQRNCISSFENLHVFHVFMRENDFDPWVTLHCATTKVLVLANKSKHFSQHVSKQINVN